MGLLDSVAGAVAGKVMGNNQGGIAGMAVELFNQNGGIGGILDKFKAGGLGEVAASWVGTGANIAVSPEQISSVLGDGKIAEMAANMGVTPEVLSAQIAEHLPTVVDKMTPNGEVDADSGNTLSSILGMFK